MNGPLANLFVQWVLKFMKIFQEYNFFQNNELFSFHYFLLMSIQTTYKDIINIWSGKKICQSYTGFFVLTPSLAQILKAQLRGLILNKPKTMLDFFLSETSQFVYLLIKMCGKKYVTILYDWLQKNFPLFYYFFLMCEN